MSMEITRTYLDYNATTPVDPAALEAMEPVLTGQFGNPSSIHSFGMEGKALLDEARARIAGLVGAKPGEIVFTSGGTESNNFAIVGAAYELRNKGTHIITTRVEHASVLEAFRFLERGGFSATYLSVDRAGLIDLDELRSSITPKTVLVSVMHVNNETGVVMPIREIAEIVKERGAVFHTDAVQAVGRVDIDFQNSECDLMSMSSHKIYGPKGVGALVVRVGLKIAPLIHGGGQERGKRSGTENVPGVAGFGKSAEILREQWRADKERIEALRDELEGVIMSTIPNARVNGHPAQRLYNTLNVGFKGVSGEAAVMSLDLEGIAVSTGSACSEGNVDPSHVLLAMGLSEEEALSSVRFSLGRFTTRGDISRVLGVLPGVVERIRSVGAEMEIGSK